MLTAFFVIKTCDRHLQVKLNPAEQSNMESALAMQITTPFIKLDSLLKAENAVSSGGEAKAMISEGYISVNGEVEFRRGRKLYPGDRVVYGKRKFLVESA
jgi:ribosome-associated protein